MVFESLIGFVNMNEYVRAIVIFVLLFFIIRFGLYFIERFLVRISKKTESDLDDILIKKTSKPITTFSLLLAIYYSLKDFPFIDLVGEIFQEVMYSLFIINISYFLFIVVDIALVRVWKKLAEKTESDVDDSVGQLVHEVLRIAIVLITVLFILNVWGIQIGPFLAGLGIAGLAVALALQPTLSNIFSGISIIIDGTFKVGDIVKLQSGEMGGVYRISLRTTRIKSFDNEMIIIPNSILASSVIQNFLQPDNSIRVNLDFGVEYGVDPEYIKKLVIEEIEKIEIVNKDEEVRVLFIEMGDSSLNFKAMFWVDDIAKKWPAHQEAITRVYRRLYNEKIGIPYPQTTVWMRDEGKVKSPDPSDSKFKSVKDKYYSAFGHEYKEENEDIEKLKLSNEEIKKKESFKNKFKFIKRSKDEK